MECVYPRGASQWGDLRYTEDCDEACDLHATDHPEHACNACLEGGKWHIRFGGEQERELQNLAAKAHPWYLHNKLFCFFTFSPPSGSEVSIQSERTTVRQHVRRCWRPDPPSGVECNWNDLVRDAQHSRGWWCCELGVSRLHLEVSPCWYHLEPFRS